MVEHEGEEAIEHALPLEGPATSRPAVQSEALRDPVPPDIVRGAGRGRAGDRQRPDAETDGDADLPPAQYPPAQCRRPAGQGRGSAALTGSRLGRRDAGTGRGGRGPPNDDLSLIHPRRRPLWHAHADVDGLVAVRLQRDRVANRQHLRPVALPLPVARQMRDMDVDGGVQGDLRRRNDAAGGAHEVAHAQPQRHRLRRAEDDLPPLDLVAAGLQADGAAAARRGVRKDLREGGGGPEGEISRRADRQRTGQDDQRQCGCRSRGTKHVHGA